MHKILVVDDEPDLCKFIKKSLEATGEYLVYTTSLPEEVLTLCVQEAPDLVLLDNVMPSMKGTEIIQSLKSNQKTSSILIVVTSGLGEMVFHEKKNEWKWEPNRSVVQERGDVIKEKDAYRAAEAYGVSDFIAKPFSQQTLLNVVHDVLRGEHGDEGEQEG